MTTRVQFEWKKTNIRDPAREALRQQAELVLAAANREVPEDSGTLKRSGRVTMDEGRAIISYDTPYAVIVHERLDVRHPRGRAKWLELAVIQAAGGGKLANAIAKAIKL